MNKELEEFDGKTSSPFALLLLEIAISMTTDEQSSLKLLLQADNHFKRNDLEQMGNGQDILRHLLYKHLITRNDLSLLKRLLLDIRRKDLVKLITNYNSSSCDTSMPSHQNVGDRLSTFPKEYCKQAELVEEEDDMLQSSQDSITDDDKLCQMVGKSSETVELDALHYMDMSQE